MADGDRIAPANGCSSRGRRRWRVPAKAAHRHCRTVCAGCRLRRVALCAVLDDDELPDLESIMVHRHRVQGQLLMMEGDPADHVISIVSGGVKLYKSLPDGRQQIVAYLMPGDCLAPPETGGYIFSAEALTETEFCEFKRRDFDRVLGKYGKLKRHMRHMAYDELVAAHDHMLVLGRKNALERLCSFLVRLRQRTLRWGGSTSPLHVPLQRTEIADYLGLSMETVSRAFSRMRSLGLIRLSSRPEQVYLVDLPRITAIAEGGIRGSADRTHPPRAAARTRRHAADGDGAPDGSTPGKSAPPTRRRADVADVADVADPPPPVWRKASPFF